MLSLSSRRDTEIPTGFRCHILAREELEYGTTQPNDPAPPPCYYRPDRPDPAPRPSDRYYYLQGRIARPDFRALVEPHGADAVRDGFGDGCIDRYVLVGTTPDPDVPHCHLSLSL